MTHIISLVNERHHILSEIFRLAGEAATQLEKEFNSAVKIQAWYRGVRLRAYLQYLHSSATVIQKQWRAFVARGIFRRLVASTLQDMRVLHYNTMATVIQKVWRGYYVRKHVHNFYARQRYLEAVVLMNACTLEDLYNYEEDVLANAAKSRADKLESDRILKATRNHFMLSTNQSAGVFGLSKCKENSEIEMIMRKLKSREIETILQKNSAEFNTSSVCTAASRHMYSSAKSNTSSYEASIVSGTSKQSPLPKILTTNKIMQGPFKPIEEVDTIKNRPLHPTLRVSTDFYSVEKERERMVATEEVGQVIDERFSPFKTVRHIYVPMLHTQSKYGSLKYGTEHFREEDESKLVLRDRFKTVLPSIKVFDQTN